MIDAICSHCGSKGKLPDTFFGREVKCRECENQFVVGGPNGKPKVHTVQRAASSRQTVAPKRDDLPLGTTQEKGVLVEQEKGGLSRLSRVLVALLVLAILVGVGVTIVLLK